MRRFQTFSIIDCTGRPRQRHISRFLPVMSVLGVCLWPSANTLAQEQPGKDASAPATPTHPASAPLQCTLQVSTEKLLPLQPLWATISLKNTSKDTVRIKEALQVFLYIQLDKGEWQAYHPENLPIASPLPPQVVAFKPGEVRSWPVYFDYDAQTREHVFAQPGTVKVKGSVGRLESPVVTITVTPPAGEDAKAYTALKSSKLARYFSGQDVSRYPHNQQTVAALESFNKNFPVSSYRPYAQLGLATLWLQGANGMDKKTASDKAKALLTKLQKSGSPPVAAQAALRLNKINAASNREAHSADSAFLQHSGDQKSDLKANPQLKAEVEPTVRTFLTALAAGRPEARQFLTSDFRMNGVLNRQQTLEEFAEDRRKLRGKLSIKPTVQEVRGNASQAVVSVRLVMTASGMNRQQSCLFTLVRSKTGWLIKQWERLT